MCLTLMEYFTLIPVAWATHWCSKYSERERLLSLAQATVLIFYADQYKYLDNKELQEINVNFYNITSTGFTEPSGWYSVLTGVNMIALQSRGQ